MSIPVRVDAVLTGSISPLGPRQAPSGIDKTPRTGPVRLDLTGLDGDVQGDPRHHGGPDKALHHYARDHYPFWRDWAPDATVLDTPGAFGENLTTTGMDETTVHVGDVYALGTATVQVSQARRPCWKLDARLGRRGTARHMQTHRLTGWYYRVLTPGVVTAGDTLTLLDRPAPDWPLDRLLRALHDRTGGPTEWAAAADLDVLSTGCRATFTARLAHGTVEDWTARLDGPAPTTPPDPAG